jgi:tRNA dimethylallyltransferase
MPARNKIHVLTGCTAAGKTELALRWAEAHGAEIVSCDSLLFYRGMDIGTAKPTATERTGVPHHLIDICGVRERMDIARYVALARTAMEDIVRRGRKVLVTGGSGFYLKAFFAPVADDVVVPEPVRERARALGHAEALAELRVLNPAGLGTLDTANPRRITRALERCLATGRPLTDLAADFARQAPPFSGWEVQLVRLERPAEELAQRIEGRVQAMLRAGLVEEVRRLVDEGLEDNPSAAKAIGYREVIAMLAGELPEAELAGSIIKDTRALVKKQRTWFRTQLPPHRIMPAATTSVVELFD